MKSTLLTTLTCFTTLVLASAGFAETGEVSIEVTDIKEGSTGKIVFLLFDQPEGFPREPDKAIQKHKVDATFPEASHTFKDVVPGTYAVSVFLDKNSNGIVDTRLKLPIEPVGASKMEKMGRPSFDKSAFVVQPGPNPIKLKFLNQ